MMIQQISVRILFGLMTTALLLSFAKARDAAESAEDILAATEVKGGLIVHVGCGDGKLAASLAESGNILVQGLESSAAVVDAVALSDVYTTDTFEDKYGQEEKKRAG